MKKGYCVVWNDLEGQSRATFYHTKEEAEDCITKLGRDTTYFTSWIPADMPEGNTGAILQDLEDLRNQLKQERKEYERGHNYVMTSTLQSIERNLKFIIRHHRQLLLMKQAEEEAVAIYSKPLLLRVLPRIIASRLFKVQ